MYNFNAFTSSSDLKETVEEPLGMPTAAPHQRSACNGETSL